MQNYHAHLIRTVHENYTSGIFTLWNGPNLLLKCFSLELPWNDNIRNSSCIPCGHYEVVADITGKHRYFKILDVVGRSAIEFHTANYVKDLGGCIGLGTGCYYPLGREQYSLINSGEALDFLKSLVDKRFSLSISYDGIPFEY